MIESQLQIRLIYSIFTCLVISTIFPTQTKLTTEGKGYEGCGKRLSLNSPLVVNGQIVTNRTEWPWHAALFKKYGEGQGQIKYICGGSIIRKSAILTVAHCVTTVLAKTVDPSSIIVVINPVSSDFMENQGVNSYIFYVKRIFVSESYDVQKDFQADIAILQLDRDIEFRDDLSVGPVCLPKEFEHDSNAVRPGKFGDVIGFGLDESRTLSKNLRVGRLEIQSHSECYFKLQRTLSDSQFCAGSQRGESWVTVCNGDSGGGLFIPSFVDGKYYIHGLVSTGDASAAKGLCQNYAVFTRIFSFLPWIQTVLKELGESHQIRQIGSSTSDFSFQQRIPYVQNGTETRRRQFFPIPHEWKNKLTSLELSHVDIEPESFLNSLEFSGKTIQILNLTQIEFTREFPPGRTVRLPHLKMISMDILKEEWNDVILNQSKSFQQSKIFQNFLNSIVFFKKDGGEESEVGLRTLGHLQVDVDIKVAIYKSIRISVQQGKISLSAQSQEMAEEILENILRRNPKNWLKHLALSKCSLNLNQILKEYGQGIKTLILDEVSSSGIEDLPSVLQNLKELEELVLISTSSNLIFNWNELPTHLKHLALTRTGINFSTNIHQNESSKLDTFFCDQCLQPSTTSSENSILHQLSTIHPNVKKIVLKYNGNWNGSEVISTTYLQNFQNLEYAYIENPTMNLGVAKKRNGILTPVNFKRSPFPHLKYVMNRYRNFWSSEGDYFGETRLTSTEMISFRTGKYLFEGRAYPNPDYSTPNIRNAKEDIFKRIPSGIQDKLEIIEVHNAQFPRSELPYSLKYCSHVKIIRLVNASSVDWPRIQAELPQLQEFKYYAPLDHTYTHFGFNGLSHLIDTAFDILLPYIEPDVNGRPFDIKTDFLRTRLQKVHLQHSKCVILSWNAEEGSLVSSGRSYTNDWLRNSKYPIKKLAFSYWKLDPNVVPKTLTHLNLNFVVMSDESVKILFQNLNDLKDLRFVNVRESEEYTQSNWEWTSVNLTQLAHKFTKTLEYLVFEKIHLRNYQKGISFHNVKTLYIESCTMESETVHNFESIFPSLKNLIILGEYQSIELILSKVLKLNGTQSMRIVTSTEWKTRSSKTAKDIQESLGVSAQNKNNFSSKYVILERVTGSGSETTGWVVNCARSRICDNDIINSQFGELGEIKGNSVFGAEPRCHALTFPQSSSHLSVSLVRQ